MIGAAAAIAAAVGPLLGGFVTTYLSWRVGFALEVVIIAVVLSQIRLVQDVPTPGPAGRRRRRGPVGRRHGRRRARHPRVAGGRRVRRPAHGRRRRRPWCSLARWLIRRKRAGSGSPCSTRTCSGTRTSPPASRAQMLQQVALGGAMIALPLFLQMTLEYNAMQAGLSLAPPVPDHVRRGPGRPGGGPATGARRDHPRRLPAGRRSGWRSSSRSSQ